MENEIDLPKRARLQEFIAETSTMQEDDLNLFYIEDEENFVLGYELCIAEKQKIVFYIAPLPDNKALLFVCIDIEGTLYGIYENMTDVTYKYGKKAWPKFFTFVDNFMNRRWHTPCLFPLEINKTTCFCVGRELENVSLSDYSSEYVSKNAEEIVMQAAEALRELQEKDMSTKDKILMELEQIFATTMIVFRTQKITDFLLGF